jgi:chlorite dismutase
MGAEENDDKPTNLLEVQPDIPEEEPIEQVFSQEPEDVRTVEPSTESEDQERFEETAKFEEEIDKSISQLQGELRKHSNARKKTDSAILDLRKELKDLLLVHHATIKDLQKQVAQMHKKIATIDSSKKSARSKTTADKKTASGKNKSSNKKSKKKSSQKNSKKR